MPKLKKKPQKRKLHLIYIFVVAIVSFFSLITYVALDTKECANSISCISDLTGAYTQEEKTGEFENKIVTVPAERDNYYASLAVLGDTSPSNKRIEVDLTNQRLYAYEGDQKMYDFLISSGKWGRTPTGEFTIWIKLRYTKMSGGSKEKGTYYYLPNVPYTMFFYNDKYPKHIGYGIHGAYWHNNFGHPMSHGCINMKEEDVEKIYYWANPTSQKHTTFATDDNPGTKVIIYGKAPAS
jgi:hypothetical protein